MLRTITLSTSKREVLVDITSQVRALLDETRFANGLVNIYALGATGEIMIQENWDDSVQQDVLNLLRKLIPKGVWEHDLQDGNGDARIKAGLVGPSETVPIIEGKLGLSTWQNIFFCEFDGPRNNRLILCTFIAA